jgi:hypothetical protein
MRSFLYRFVFYFLILFSYFFISKSEAATFGNCSEIVQNQVWEKSRDLVLSGELRRDIVSDILGSLDSQSITGEDLADIQSAFKASLYCIVVNESPGFKLDQSMCAEDDEYTCWSDRGNCMVEASVYDDYQVANYIALRTYDGSSFVHINGQRTNLYFKRNKTIVLIGSDKSDVFHTATYDHALVVLGGAGNDSILARDGQAVFAGEGDDHVAVRLDILDDEFSEVRTRIGSFNGEQGNDAFALVFNSRFDFIMLDRSPNDGWEKVFTEIKADYCLSNTPIRSVLEYVFSTEEGGAWRGRPREERHIFTVGHFERFSRIDAQQYHSSCNSYPQIVELLQYNKWPTDDMCQ